MMVVLFLRADEFGQHQLTDVFEMFLYKWFNLEMQINFHQKLFIFCFVVSSRTNVNSSSWLASLIYYISHCNLMFH